MCIQVGGIEEYRICDGLKSGRLFKPIIAWCIGTCAKMFTSEVQFGHAGACANAERETADSKNKASIATTVMGFGVVTLMSIQALTEAGAYVPESFDTLGLVIRSAFG